MSNPNVATTPRVFVVGPGSHDYGPASRYGEIVHVLDSRCNPFKTDELMSQLVDVFTKYNVCQHDFVIFGGSAVLNAIAVMYLVQTMGKLKVLIYGAKHHDYIARDISVKQLSSVIGSSDDNVGNIK